MKPLTVRWLIDDDAPALGELFESNNVTEVTRHFHPFPLTRETAVRLCRTGERRDIYGAAFAGERVVGMYMLRGWDEGYRVPSFGVLVHGAERGRGLGRVLIERAVADALARGSPAIRLTVNRDNPAAIRLYDAAGFREVESRMEGSGEVVVMMRVFEQA